MPIDKPDNSAAGDGDVADPSPVASLPANAVEVRGLTKTYAAQRRGKRQFPAKTALQEIDLAVPRGSLFGLLGPNGAGKSTLINILAGLVNKTSGQALVWGHDVVTAARKARSAIGVVPQELNIDPFFTPYELLDLQAGLYGVPKAERRTAELLETVGLTDKADAYTRTLSGGMRRRLLVAKAMVHSPPVLVLDEPTAGVDIDLRRQLWTHVRALNRQGVTILLTTHYLEEAETLCDRIAIIDQGRVVAYDRTRTLLAGHDSKTMILTLARPLETIPAGLSAYDPSQTGPNRLELRYRPSTVRADKVLAAVRDAGLEVVDLETTQARLEDLFLALTGRVPDAETDAEAAGARTR